MTAGITGHQNLGDEAAHAWVRSELGRAIDRYSITHGFTCLALGADQLFAEILDSRGIPFTAVIPCDQYVSTFTSPAGFGAFERLRSRSVETLRLAFKEPSEIAFYEAGKLVADKATTLVAVWNGLPARGLGGTGDIVAYALTKGKRVLHINPAARTTEELRQKVSG